MLDGASHGTSLGVSVGMSGSATVGISRGISWSGGTSFGALDADKTVGMHVPYACIHWLVRGWK